MPATIPTATLYAGMPFGRKLTFLRDEKDGNGPQPRLLVTEGWSDWRVQWRKTRFSEEFIEAEIDASQAEQGIIKFKFSGTQTRLMNVPGVWDMQAHQGGESYTWWTGSTAWMNDVTRPD